ncbi:MAG: SLC13 family permease [Bernardetiaceae bacterium]
MLLLSTFLLPEVYQKWLVLFVLIFIILSLLREWLKPELTFLMAVLMLLMSGIVRVEDFLNSLANRQIATIFLLIIITSALQKNFNLEAFFDRIFKNAKTDRGFLWRMCAAVVLLSSFLNNTPVVAVMTPYVYNWSKRFSSYPSKLLIPLSYATILGGMLTMIGTSTNLVLNGFLIENKIPPLGFTDFFYLGLLVVSIGILYLYTVGYRLLPENKEAFKDMRILAPEYLVETEIAFPSRLIGKTLDESGLNQKRGVYLIELHRKGQLVSPIPPQETLLDGDRLFFMGKPETIFEMVSGDSGLRLPNHDKNMEVVEAVIPANSSLNGKSVDQVRFKERYGVEILAIHRNGDRVGEGSVEGATLAHGDLLLLSVNESFFKNSDAKKDFYALSKVQKSITPPKINLQIFMGASLLLLSCVIWGVFSLFLGLLLMLGVMLLLRLYDVREIAAALDIELVILLASALLLGNTMIKTDAATPIVSALISWLAPYGSVVILLGLFLMTVLLTSFVTNVAAISIMFPFAYSLSEKLGIDSPAFYVGIAFAASAAFITPVSYQTNWMVYGPGGYRSRDFVRVGLPLAGIYALVCMVFISFRYGLVG